MSRRKIIIQNNKKQKLVGYLYPKKSHTILIACHGIISFSEAPEAIPFFEKYSKACTVFAFDFSGHGGSEGYDKYSFQQEVADVGSVIAYFKKDFKNIILYGLSLGGSVAAISTTKYPEVNGLVLLNASFNFWQTNPSFFIYALLYHIRNKRHREEYLYLKNNLTPKNISIPVLIVYGEKDKMVWPIQSLNFYKKLQTNKELYKIPNGDHALADKKYLPYTAKVTNWISKTFPE